MGAGHDHHGHGSGGSPHAGRLALTLGLVVVYMIVEAVGGWLSGSLALMADAGHMLSDAAALTLALVALRIAARPPTEKHTFGFRRAEILAALANGGALLAIAGIVSYEAVQRIGAPTAVDGPLMLGVGAGGLVINLLGLAILSGGRQDSLNVRGAWLHVMADALGSVGAMLAGVGVTWFGFGWADPVASLAIAILVVYSAWSLIRQTVGVLMQAVPEHIDIRALERVLTGIEGVLAVHDLHVWSVTSGRDVMSAHLSLDGGASREQVVRLVHRAMEQDFDLHHSTIQLDCPAGCTPCGS